MKELLIIGISAAIVNNVVLSQFLGLCPFFGVSKKIETAAGMGGAVIFVITLSSFVTSLIYKYILANPHVNMQFLQTIVFILVIAALVQFVEMFLKKSMPALYQSLGVYLPLITTNCAPMAVRCRAGRQRGAQRDPLPQCKAALGSQGQPDGSSGKRHLRYGGCPGAHSGREQHPRPLRTVSGAVCGGGQRRPCGPADGGGRRRQATSRACTLPLSRMRAIL